MTVFGEFYEHNNFAGDSYTAELTNNWRYWWVKFGSDLKNEVSSMRAKAYGGRSGNAYGFTRNDFLGDMATLNMGEGWTCWWSSLGGNMNDDVESGLLVNRSTDEIELNMNDLLRDAFRDAFDEATAGTQVSRRGNPRIYSVFWPSWDGSRKFVRIEQKMNVELDWWPDYDAKVQYDVYFYVSGGELRAYVARTRTWVEGGIFTGSILDELHPQMVDGADSLDEQLESGLSLLNILGAIGGGFNGVYLLPGNPPAMTPPVSNSGRQGSAYENSTVVITT